MCPVGVAEAINDDGREETETRWGLTEVLGTVVWVEEIVKSVGTAGLRLSCVAFVVLALSDAVIVFSDVVREDPSTGVAFNPQAVAAVDTESP